MEYDNGGDVLWFRVTHIWGLERKEESLRKDWVEHVQKIAEGVGSASENTSASITVRRRPEKKFCTVQFKIFPRATEGAAARTDTI
jgi:hypothetical protein